MEKDPYVKCQKTMSGNRTIPMNNSAESALLELRKGNSTPYVIINSRGNQVLPSNFERSFHALLKRAEINGNYGVHALRHTFASMFFSKGVDVKIVSKLLGHSSVKITYDTYVHLFEKDIKCITDILDYSETTNSVRYIYCDSLENGADQPYYLQLDW